MKAEDALSVALLGFGAIGSRVAESLTDGSVPGARLVGVIARNPGPIRERGFQLMDRGAACTESDVIVECAGGSAVREHGPAVILSGRDLLLTSVGVLADAPLRRELFAGPGHCFLTTGAVGGLDLLQAAARDGGLTRASITSTKRASALVQPWMDEAETARLRTTAEPFELFHGSVAEAILSYPASLNVAVALAHATGLWDEARVQLIADPAVTLTTHEIRASGPAGDYRFTMTNNPLPDNPASSAVVASAILRGIGTLARPGGAFV